MNENQRVMITLDQLINKEHPYRKMKELILEDLSDRQMMKFLQENVSGKWFCEFSLTEKTPEFTLFTKVRASLGIERIEQIFK